MKNKICFWFTIAALGITALFLTKSEVFAFADNINYEQQDCVMANGLAD